MRLAKLQPQFHARPWGRNDLSPLYTRPPGTTDPIGEVWLSSVECRVLGPAISPPTMRLGEYWAQLTLAEIGTDLQGLPRFPLLIKFIFTAEKLSVQVHPDDDYARRHEREPWGKTEMWYVVAAEPGAWVRVGLRPGTTRETLRSVFGQPEMEDILNPISVRAGEAIYVPAGTLHAIGPGLCLCEIQQYSDVTYRVWDYDRLGLDGHKRALHQEQALAVARHKTPEAGRQCPTPVGHGARPGQLLLSSPYFAVEKYEITDRLELRCDAAHFDLLIFCAGGGTLTAGANRMEYMQGDAFLVTADSGRVVFQPHHPTELLRAFASSGFRAKAAR